MNSTPATKQISDATPLIHRIRQGDTAAEETFFRDYQISDHIRRMILSMQKLPTADINDLIAEVQGLLILKLRRGDYKPELGRLGPFVWGITRNKLREHLKRTRRAYRITQNVHALEEISMTDPEAWNISISIKQCISELDEKYQTVLFLKYYLDLTTEEMAARLNLQPVQIYNRIHYALRLLRNYGTLAA